jgi:DNA mismatch repair protein MutH
MSFPVFRLGDFETEEWEDAELPNRLNRLLLVPLVRPGRSFARDQATLGRAFFWTPSDPDFVRIRESWESYRDRVRSGTPDDYPRRSDRQAIFVNSHGATARDRVDFRGQSVMKRSFWLHPELVSAVLVGSHPLWRGY